MTGAQIDYKIRRILETIPTVHGYHNPDSRRVTMRGFPDWVFIGERGILWREVKGSDDTVTQDQRRIGRLISLNGGDWRVWGPLDVAATVEKELRAIA